MSSADKKQDKLFYDAAQLVLENNNASPEFIQSILNVDEKRANDILDQLETEGLISADSGSGRSVLMSIDDFKMIFAGYFNTQTNKNNATATNVSGNQTVNTSPAPVKKKTGCGTCLLWALLVLLLLLLIDYYRGGYVYYTVRRYRPNTSDIGDSGNTKNSNTNANKIDINSNTNKTNEMVSETEASSVNIITGWVQEGSNYKYYDPRGNQVRSAWVDYDNNLYYIAQNGYLEKNKWIQYLGKEYYVDGNGVMLKNQWIDNTYYVGPDGAKLTNTKTPDGYFVDSNGIYIPSVPYIAEADMSNTPVYSQDSQPRYYQQEPNSLNSINIIDQAIDVNSNQTTKSSKRYLLKRTISTSERVYLENDKSCNIKLLLPEFVNEEGVLVDELNQLVYEEIDNIYSELHDIADSSIEDEGSSSRKYISSFNFNEGRIQTQDEYSITYKMVGKANWNSGKTKKISLNMTFDKEYNNLTYYIDY